MLRGGAREGSRRLGRGPDVECGAAAGASQERGAAERSHEPFGLGFVHRCERDADVGEKLCVEAAHAHERNRPEARIAAHAHDQLDSIRDARRPLEGVA